MLADPSNVLHPTFWELSVKIEKKTSLHVRNSASIGKCRQINTHCELFNMNTLHICSKHAPDSLCSAFRTAYWSHKRAARPTHTSTFYHRWLPVAPHKLPITHRPTRSVMCHCFVLCVASQPNNNDTLPKSGQSQFGECVIAGVPWPIKVLREHSWASAVNSQVFCEIFFVECPPH